MMLVKTRPTTRRRRRSPKLCAWCCYAGLTAALASIPLYLQATICKTAQQAAGRRRSMAALPLTLWSSDYYSSREEQESRRGRFPSVEDRVRIYMDRWYAPPCHESDKVSFNFVNETKNNEGQSERFLVVRELSQIDDPVQRTFVVPSRVFSAKAIYLRRQDLLDCDYPYCEDTRKYFLPALDRLESSSLSSNNNIPTVFQYVFASLMSEGLRRVSFFSLLLLFLFSPYLQPSPLIERFGDSGSTQGYVSTSLEEVGMYPRFPIIKKFRPAVSGGLDEVRARTQASCVTGPRPLSDTYIVWRLTSKRHFGPLPSIPPLDVPWDQKKSIAVFRGALTGKKRDGFRPNLKLNDQQKCLMMHRCKLVYHSATSPLVDARLTPAPSIVSGTIGDVQLVGDKLNYEEMLQYKAIIMLEGNDVSSGFKWAMFSNSVVMTQAPTKS